MSLAVVFMASLAIQVVAQGKAAAAPAAKKPMAPPKAMPDVEAASSEGDSFYDSHLKGKLEIGTRATYFMLLEDERGEPFHNSFVGSITILKEDEDYLPIKLFAQYLINPMVGLGLSYDEFGSEAWDYGGTDGTTVLSGPLLYVLGRYPNSTAFTPFCEAGVALYSAKFEEDAGWGKSNNKEFVLDDPMGIYVAVGCDWQVYENWSVDIYSRYMNVDVDGVYMMNGERQEDIIFTTSYLALGLGVKYAF
jgi:outer membrane protein W